MLTSFTHCNKLKIRITCLRQILSPVTGSCIFFLICKSMAASNFCYDRKSAQGSPLTKQMEQLLDTGRYKCARQGRDMSKLRKGTDAILHVI